MTETEALIQKYMQESKEFKEAYLEERKKSEIALALIQLREEKHLSQRELAKLVGKPQSTIARIENQSMNPSFDLLSEIAEKVGKEMKIEFV